MDNIVIFCDGSSSGNKDRKTSITAWRAVVLQGGVVIDTTVGTGYGDSNEAEAKGIIAGIHWLLKSAISGDVTLKTDSKYIINLLTGGWECKKSTHIRKLVELINHMISLLHHQNCNLIISHVRSKENIAHCRCSKLVEQPGTFNGIENICDFVHIYTEEQKLKEQMDNEGHDINEWEGEA
jgi:ribonuclease HI